MVSNNYGTMIGEDASHEDVEGNERKSENKHEKHGKKYPYPKSVPFIVSTEFCERFSYYGMKSKNC